MDRQTRWTDWVLAALILVIAAAARMYCLACEPLWLDEGYSWWDARQSLADLWNLVPQCDPHPPLYALLLKGWIALVGDSAAALRGLSTLLNVSAVAAIILAGREINMRTGLIAGLLFAVAPFQIEFSIEARPYTLLVLGAALLVFGALRILRIALRGRTGAEATGRTHDAAGWIAFILGGTLTLWANNTAVLMLAAAALALLGVLWREPRARGLVWSMLLAGACIVALWLPYLPVYLEQARGVSADFWIPRPDAWRVANELRFVVGYGSFQIFYALAVVYVAGLILLWRSARRAEAIMLAGLFLLPVALNFAVSLAIKPVFIARALIGVAPAFVIGVAAALAAMNFAALRFALVAALCVSAFWRATALYEPQRKEPWDQIATALSGEAHGNAVALMIPNELVLPLTHALETSKISVPLRGVPADFPAPGLPTRYPSGKCAPSVNGEDLSWIEQAAHRRDTVFFITRRDNVYDPQERIRAVLLAQGMVEVERREFMPGYLQLRRYVRADSIPH